MSRAAIILALLAGLAGPGWAAEPASISIVIKPAKGLTGTVSFNLNADGSMSRLIYKSATQLQQETLKLEPSHINRIRLLAKNALDELLQLKNPEVLPEYRQNVGIIHSQFKVSKSVSTHRYSTKVLRLLRLLKDHGPVATQMQTPAK